MATTSKPARCTPDQVFDVLDDGWTYPLWVVGASRMRDVDPGWPEPGARLHHSVGLWPLLIDDTTSCVEYERGRRIRLTARGWPAGEADVLVEVEPNADGCLVTITEDASEGPGTLVPGVLRHPALRIRNDEALRRLVLLAEGRAAHRGDGS
ncbi:SRPBCC family protein [Thalassiella azotivora]